MVKLRIFFALSVSVALGCVSMPARANSPTPEADDASAAVTNALPPAIRQMLESALAEGNDAEIAAIAKYAARTVPEAQREIDAMMTRYRDHKEAQRQQRLSDPDIFALWEGKIELGGFRSTGTTSEFGVSASLSAKRQGVKWTHVLYGNVDYRRANGETSRDRFVLSYAPRYKAGLNGFIYGLAQYEHDPFVGYDNRYSGSAGFGYKPLQTDSMNLSIDVGPSLRHVEYIDGTAETKLGGRSSADFEWKLSPTLTFRQTASGYAEKDVISLNSLTALDTKLISVLTARLSYNVQYENDDRLSSKRLDTLSKVTLIYDF
tara:strand:- start:91966 stop:92922 length:957 start_codon:yes stop_codon:yes gene_type:complete